MKIKEITLSTGPTVKINRDYYKANCSIVVEIDQNKDYKKEIDLAMVQLNKLYARTLLCEIVNVETYCEDDIDNMIKTLKRKLGIRKKVKK